MTESPDTPELANPRLPRPANPVVQAIRRRTRAWFTADPAKVTTRAVRLLHSHAAEHGGTGPAVIEAMGERGFRIVALAADGAFVDAVVGSAEQAERVINEAGYQTSEWDRDTTDRVRIADADRRRMAGRR